MSIERPDGTPLPAKPNNTVDYRQNDARVYAPTSKSAENVTIFERKQSAADDRVRKARADQYRSFFRRRHGRPATDGEVNAFLDGPDVA